MSKQAVAILGCGPAGLLCAQAAYSMGRQPIIYSQKQKSEIPGSLHLRSAIPDVTPVYPDSTVTMVRMGTPEGYGQKVYGDPKRETGWDNYMQVYPSWNAHKAYDLLWNRFESCIVDQTVSRTSLLALTETFSQIISTLPLPVICEVEDHEFKFEPYWIKTLPTPPGDRDKEVIIYNGILSDHWYRYSILGGVCAIETTREQGSSWIEGRKAVSNNCDCWEGEVHRAGRWAEWKHGVLLNHAYEKTIRILKGAAA